MIRILAECGPDVCSLARSIGSSLPCSVSGITANVDRVVFSYACGPRFCSRPADGNEGKQTVDDGMHMEIDVAQGLRWFVELAVLVLHEQNFDVRRVQCVVSH